MASGIRLGEITEEDQAHERTVGVSANVAREINSTCHDVLTEDQERDYQDLGRFSLPTLWKYSDAK